MSGRPGAAPAAVSPDWPLASPRPATLVHAQSEPHAEKRNMTPVTSGMPSKPSGRPSMADSASDGGTAALWTLPARRTTGSGTALQPLPSRQPQISALARAAVPAAVPSFRHHTRDVLARWGVSQAVRETAEHLVSELATNAVRVSARIRYATVGLQLSWSADGVLIKVHDVSADMPDRRASTSDDESGRGLMLVDCLSQDWGVYQTVGRGKVVWCIVGRQSAGQS
jgi:anti-sigma regulatory factor (Ser/Thr protein kinase)